jgi:hypothetical protein
MDRADTILVAKCAQALIHDPDDKNNLILCNLNGCASHWELVKQ